MTGPVRLTLTVAGNPGPGTTYSASVPPPVPGQRERHRHAGDVGPGGDHDRQVIGAGQVEQIARQDRQADGSQAPGDVGPPGDAPVVGGPPIDADSAGSGAGDEAV